MVIWGVEDRQLKSGILSLKREKFTCFLGLMAKEKEMALEVVCTLIIGM